MGLSDSALIKLRNLAVSLGLLDHARRAAKALGIGMPPLAAFGGTLDDVPDAERNSTDLHRIYYANTGAQVCKWRGYLDVYDRHLRRFRGTKVRLLEIGVSRGGSLQVWRNYLGNDAVIFGIDVNPACAGLGGGFAEVRIGSQTDAAFLRSVVGEMGGLDVVIDDGSHIASHQRTSFETLFPLIEQSGVYICEDAHSAYWRGPYEGGYRRRTSFIELCKDIVDDLHADFHGRAERLPHAHRTISGVHFYNSIIVIEKHPQSRPMYVAVPS
jgi:hypothetical protein